MHCSTCVIPPYFHFAFDFHHFSHPSDYVVICMNNIYLVFWLVVPAISSIVYGFSIYKTIAFWTFLTTQFFKLFMFLFRSKMTLHGIIFPFSFGGCHTPKFAHLYFKTFFKAFRLIFMTLILRERRPSSRMTQTDLFATRSPSDNMKVVYLEAQVKMEEKRCKKERKRTK